MSNKMFTLTVPVTFKKDGKDQTSFRRVGAVFENTRENGETVLSIKLDFPVAVTELVAFPPLLSIAICASSRVKPSMVPETTKVAPASESDATPSSTSSSTAAWVDYASPPPSRTPEPAPRSGPDPRPGHPNRTDTHESQTGRHTTFRPNSKPIARIS